MGFPSEYPEDAPLPPLPAFHTECSERMDREQLPIKLCPTCRGGATQEADEVGREGTHACFTCNGARYVREGIPSN